MGILAVERRVNAFATKVDSAFGQQQANMKRLESQQALLMDAVKELSASLHHRGGPPTLSPAPSAYVPTLQVDDMNEANESPRGQEGASIPLERARSPYGSGSGTANIEAAGGSSHLARTGSPGRYPPSIPFLASASVTQGS